MHLKLFRGVPVKKITLYIYVYWHKGLKSQKVGVRIVIGHDHV